MKLNRVKYRVVHGGIYKQNFCYKFKWHQVEVKVGRKIWVHLLNII